MAPRPASKKGFAHAGRLLQGRIREAGEGRGFAVSKLLTHWAEIMGPDIADIALPVEVKYGRQGFGATLTLLTTGANAPLLAMQKEQIRDKANACYGYNAISRVAITQTAPTGFAEGQVAFTPKPAAPRGPDPQTLLQAQDLTRAVGNPKLQEALERLGQNVLSKSQRNSKGL